MTQPPATREQPYPAWRFRSGVIVFIVGFFSPLLIPVVASMDLPLAWKATISGLLAVGIPEIFALVAVAILGKSGFNYLKARIFGFLKKHGPPDSVSRTRYRLGLVLFAIPIIFGWLAPYAPHLIPRYDAYRFWVNLIGDVILLSSLFVLGGDFWDKIRALFICEAKALIPGLRNHREATTI